MLPSKLVLLVGTRPNYIKASILSKELLNKNVPHIIVDTGQHYDPSLAQISDEMGLTIAKNLNLGSELDVVTMADKVSLELRSCEAEYVVVFGDTRSTLAGAIAAKQCGCYLFHVEGGLRSGNWSMTEEYNRRVTDYLSDCIFLNDAHGLENIKEFYNKTCYVVGNIVAKAFLDGTKNFEIDDLPASSRLIVTIHRKENLSAVRIASLVRTLELLRSKVSSIVVLGHPSFVKAIAEAKNLINVDCGILLENITLPTSRVCMISNILQKGTTFLTDSGGLFQECCLANTPAILFRNEHEFKAIDEYCDNFISSTSSSYILSSFSRLTPSSRNKGNPGYNYRLLGHWRADTVAKDMAKIIRNTVRKY